MRNLKEEAATTGQNPVRWTLAQCYRKARAATRKHKMSWSIVTRNQETRMIMQHLAERQGITFNPWV